MDGIKTTNEIIEKSARYIKDKILVLNDNDKKWISLTDLFIAMGNTNAKIYNDGNGSYEWNEILCKELGIDVEWRA